MLPDHVEAQFLQLDDVVLQSFLSGRGQQALRPVALVQNAVEEHRLVVHEETQDALAVAIHAELAHAEVGVHSVSAVGGLQIVQVGGIGSPGLALAQGDDLILVDSHFCFSHHAAFVQDADLGGAGAVGEDMDADSLLVEQGRDLDLLDVVSGNAFQPDGLPDAALGGVEQGTPLAGAVQLLLAAGMGLLFGGILNGQGQNVFAVIQICGDVEGEGIVAALVAADFCAVDENGTFLIDSAKVQDDAILLETFGQGKDLAVVQVVRRLNDLLNTGQQGFGRVGNQNGAVVTVSGGSLVDAVFPVAVQIQETVTNHAGTGIFGQSVLRRDFLCPSAFQLDHIVILL